MWGGDSAGAGQRLGEHRIFRGVALGESESHVSADVRSRVSSSSSSGGIGGRLSRSLCLIPRGVIGVHSGVMRVISGTSGGICGLRSKGFGSGLIGLNMGLCGANIFRSCAHSTGRASRLPENGVQ